MEGALTYTFDLAPGKYHFWASGGLHVSDLDTLVRDTLTGSDIDSDEEGDKIPIVVFTVEEQKQVDIELVAYAFEEGFTEDYFCLVVAVDNEGEITSVSGGPDEEPSKSRGKQGSTDYQAAMQAVLDDWNSFSQENNFEVISSDMFLTGSSKALDFQLEPGVYAMWAQADPRCLNVDLKITGSNDTILAENTEGDNAPYAEFLVSQNQTVTALFELSDFSSGASESYVAYLLKRQSGIDDASRRAWVQDQLDSLVFYAEGDGATVIDSGMNTITRQGGIVTLSYELGPGTYVCNSTGGVLLSNLDMAAYAADGSELFSDTYPDSFPVCAFTLTSTQTVTINITAVAFRGSSTSEYYCWCLSGGDVYAPQG
jgi:hypothetical protein